MSKNHRSGCGRFALWGGALAGVVAAILSYSVNRSIGWALVHFVCSGFYIIYWLVVYLPGFIA